ncbi:3',5'-cyclic-nucleotide phosphodiesterase [Methylobacterium sp. C25]|uniref:3',5'-cyclic-nucleotide phosphodiesterase n=1 Tax=Methylobacterium sp. C25 TaxID=2721622 RepID=UPI001F3037D7|nr:3',5'-cyclic-nucleotide phosphodiesterase [Methylobacterium sp. C25]MCE4223731.1 3',5'-cyclic-nucleotide phosphodiesterase [Methylobacterium sp. C25]
MALNLKPFALAVTALAVASTAQAVESRRGNDTLKKYCTGDYLSYCGNLAPDDPATDACFKTNWKKLSENCRRAIDAYTPTPAEKSGKRG